MNVFLNCICIAIITCFATQGFAQRIVCDETCKVEFQHAADEQPATDGVSKQDPHYAVVSPVGLSTVEMIGQAERLNTLEGKTIAVVGESFMTSITHPEIKRLILQQYPTAKVILLDEIGTAGVFSAPGVQRRSQMEFRQKLKEMGVDAVIAGNCGCGLCTPKEMGSVITAEYLGIPAVVIAAPGFINEAYYTAINNGIPAPRVVEYPGAFATHTREQLLKNIQEKVWPQLVKALTMPITETEKQQNVRRDKGDIRDDVFYGTIDEVNRYFTDMRWSDGLPIIPPTYKKVQEFLRFTDRDWNETVTVLPVAHRNVTVWHVAVNAVMAGCKPEYMPVLLAMTEGLKSGDFRRTLQSTHGWNPYCWLNGPVARQLGIVSGQGEISQVANASIGRFMNLALINLSGYYIGENRMGTFGYLMPWCLAEDEQICKRIGWQPYHVQQGFNINDNTITLASALNWGNNMAPSTTDPKALMQLMAWDIADHSQFALGSGKQFTNRTILITPPVAEILVKGYRSFADLEQDLINNSRRPLTERAFANYYANPGSAPEQKHPFNHYKAHLSRSEKAQLTPPSEWYDTDQAQIQTIATMKQGMTALLVTGDESRNKLQTMPGGGITTVKITLPNNWNSLMKEAGYRPLDEFFIN